MPCEVVKQVWFLCAQGDTASQSTLGEEQKAVTQKTVLLKRKEVSTKVEMVGLQLGRAQQMSSMQLFGTDI